MTADLPHVGEIEAPLSEAELTVLRRQYEREFPQPSAQSRFNYAWGLIKSTKRQQQLLGVELLTEVCRTQPERERECLYYLALGHHKLGDHITARRYNDALLTQEPRNRQAQELQALIDQRVMREGLLGMTIVGSVAVGLGIALVHLFRR